MTRCLAGVPDRAPRLLINGEPLDGISVLRDPDTALVLVMKQGEIVKLEL